MIGCMDADNMDWTLYNQFTDLLRRREYRQEVPLHESA